MPTETSFVPTDVNCQDWAQLKPLFEDLISRDLGSTQDLEQWLLELSDLESYIADANARLHVDMTCDTDSVEKAEAYRNFNQTVRPEYSKAAFELSRKFYESPHRAGLDSARYAVLDRAMAADIEIYREENVPIETKLGDLSQEHIKITGAWKVDFQGKERTFPEMAKFQENTDRSVREGAWCAVSKRIMEDFGTLRQLFDNMLELRHKVATNADFDNYRDYIFKKKHRFDYTPETCFSFHDAIADHVVPLYRDMLSQRAAALGVDVCRPWDQSVDVKGRGPLDPFNSDVDRMVEVTRDIFKGMDPKLGELFESLCDGTSLDLDTRPGKSPGGYQTTFAIERRPFIFMNASGIARDLRTLLHEAGHAFHTLLAKDEPLFSYRMAPMEFCEVASMSMELTAQPWYDRIYDSSEDADRAWRVQLEGVVRVLCWVAQIDAFQHWLYTNPGHSHEQRAAEWGRLNARFGGGVDWTGWETFEAESWQRQLHLFRYPFYYIEYGIAQLGALQIWRRHRESPTEAIASYKDALTIGGARPLPELFEVAGTRFDFGGEMIKTLMDDLGAELQKLPQ